MPAQNGPKPDYASGGPLYEDGYDNVWQCGGNAAHGYARWVM
jgi:hypothetical protein